MACKTKGYSNGGFVGTGVDNSDPGKKPKGTTTLSPSKDELKSAKRLAGAAKERDIQNAPARVGKRMTNNARNANLRLGADVLETNYKRKQ